MTDYMVITLFTSIIQLTTMVRPGHMHWHTMASRMASRDHWLQGATNDGKVAERGEWDHSFAIMMNRVMSVRDCDIGQRSRNNGTPTVPSLSDAWYNAR
jgi:hypothetical protein